ANIVGCHNAYEAARRNGLPRFVFPTSNHAVGFYRRDQTIDHRVYPKPDGRYGVPRASAEALGSLYADKYGLRVLCIRIGNVNERPIDKRRLAIWVSPRDLGQLVSLGVERPDLRLDIVYGVSDNRRAWYDNANAKRLGYQPQDRGEDYAAVVLAKEPPGTGESAEPLPGGTLVTAE